jgi:hypothetical protein
MWSFIVYLPYFFVNNYNGSPENLYWFSWAGSIFVIFVTLTNIAHQRPKDLPFISQFFRPYIFAQLIFAFYHCIATVFYYFSLQGYFFFEKISPNSNINDLQLVALCQSYCLLAHTAFAHGTILQTSKYGKDKVNNATQPKELINVDLFFKISIFCIVSQFLIKQLGFLSAILAVVYLAQNTAIVLTLIYAIREKRKLLLATTLFIFNLIILLTSGLKEGVIVLAILLFFNFFPKNKIITLTVALFIGNLMIYLPQYTINVRQVVWYGGGTLQEAFDKTYQEITTTDEIEIEKVRKNNWSFLIHRISEIDALKTYVVYIDGQKGYDGTEILKHGILAVIPSFIRTDGLSTDKTAQERAYQAGALDRFVGEAGTSAKPAMVADCYMVGGRFAIFIICFLSGYMATFFSVLCEKYFGGYTIGTVIIFNACFYIFLKGHCMENLFGSMAYGVLTVFVLHYFNKQYNIFGNQE